MTKLNKPKLNLTTPSQGQTITTSKSSEQASKQATQNTSTKLQYKPQHKSQKKPVSPQTNPTDFPNPNQKVIANTVKPSILYNQTIITQSVETTKLTENPAS